MTLPPRGSRVFLGTLLTLTFVLSGTSVGAEVLVPLRPGPNNNITDVDGILVGHFTNVTPPSRTGTTVLLLPDQAVAGVDVRGGGPGTIETDVLDARRPVNKLDALFLSGGSAYGLAARAGVVQCVEEQSKGFRLGGTPDREVPMVAGAIIFDLGRGGDGAPLNATGFKARPTRDFGYRACKAAAKGPIDQGSLGAGAGAVSGGMKGGIGSASVDLGNGVIVAAIVTVNSVGSTVRPDTCELYTAYLELGNELGDYKKPPTCAATAASTGPEVTAEEKAGKPAAPGDKPKLPIDVPVQGGATQPLNTTIGVVATNVKLTKAQINFMATAAHDGMARSIRPAHTLLDGDTIFALSTEKIDLACVSDQVNASSEVVVSELHSAAADAFSRATNQAILRATTIGTTPRSYCSVYAGACGTFPVQNNQVSTGACVPNPIVGRLSATGGRYIAAAAGLVLLLLGLRFLIGLRRDPLAGTVA